MKISEVNNSILLDQYKINNKSVPDSKKETRPDDFKEKVSLSSTSRDIELAKEAINNSQDVRYEKLQTLKDEIRHGTYHISEEKIAEKMLNEFFSDIHSLFIDIHK